MNTTIKAALITGICGIVAGGVGGSLITNNLNVNENVNNNTLVITTSSGEQEKVTVEDYTKIQKDNEELKENLESLEENNKKLQESLAINNQKSEEIKSSNIKFLDLLYDGYQYKVYKTSDGGEGLKIGGKEYTDAFKVYGSHTFVLFNLDKKYNLTRFNVGRIDDSEICDANIKVYLDNNLSGEYAINAQTPLTPIEINLAGATTLKIELTADSYVEYGFMNFELQ